MRRMMILGPLVGLASSLSACAGTPMPLDRDELMLGACDAAAAQDLIGRQASAPMGQRLLAATGARVLRWAPPRSALTMDYVTDRLTVEYDEAMVIRRISCG